MAQFADLGQIPNGTGAAVRADINSSDTALASSNSGAAAPDPTYAWMIWIDTTSETIKRRDSANTSWEILEAFNESTDPTVSDDAGDGYIHGSIWKNTTGDKIFVCTDPSTGAAVWQDISAGGAGSEVNDLTASVTWANVPDANITESSVTQHEAAINHNELDNYSALQHINWTASSNNFATSGTAATGALTVTGAIAGTHTGGNGVFGLTLKASAASGDFINFINEDDFPSVQVRKNTDKSGSLSVYDGASGSTAAHTFEGAVGDYYAVIGGYSADRIAGTVLTVVGNIGVTGTVNGQDVAAIGALATSALQPVDFDANTILVATTDDTPAAITIAENDIVMRLPSGNIIGNTSGDLTEETTPATGDFLLGWESGGAIRKFDVGDLPSGTAFSEGDTQNQATYTVEDGGTVGGAVTAVTPDFNDEGGLLMTLTANLTGSFVAPTGFADTTTVGKTYDLRWIFRQDGTGGWTFPVSVFDNLTYVVGDMPVIDTTATTGTAEFLLQVKIVAGPAVETTLYLGPSWRPSDPNTGTYQIASDETHVRIRSGITAVTLPLGNAQNDGEQYWVRNFSGGEETPGTLSSQTFDSSAAIPDGESRVFVWDETDTEWKVS